MKTTKTCSRCKQLKDTQLFHRDKTRKDGHCTWCKECAAFNLKRYLNRVKDTEEYKSKRRVVSLKYYHEKDKAKNLARQKARRNVTKLSQCEKCGDDSSKLELHHDSYDRPLDVKTLCIKCHEGVHHRGLIV